MDSPKNKVAVILFQLGGPDSLDSIEPFLFNLFSDPDIINFPGAFLARSFIARKISSNRSKKVRENYRAIGGRSPILALTRAQAIALEQSLNEHTDAEVFIAMRYWHPNTEEVILKIKHDTFSKIILLPLYPQYSKATTLSSLKEWKKQCALLNYNPIQLETIESFHNHPSYINAITNHINTALLHFVDIDMKDIDLVFSAHSVPESYVKKGDPYQDQVLETVKLVVHKGKWNSPHTVGYQSKVGPIKWLGPSLHDTITELTSSGRKNFLIIPISFVTDHIETLHEIGIEMRRFAMESGANKFEIMPALNNDNDFIECLTALVLERI
ncbi:MAG: ferrochelatase [Ignavibacteriales bacterium]|nr:ferrochelatase [Ignavibacteriales bacterium]